MSNAPTTFKKCLQKCCPSEKRNENCHVLANSRWEVLFKADGTAAGKLLGNGQITAASLKERR